MCSTSQYLGKKRSILQCSEACAREASCLGFFFNHLNNECSGTSVVYVVTTECQWTGDNTYFYLDAQENCDYGWLVYDGHCYWQDVSSRTWYDAKGICDARGALLVSVETESEFDFIRNNFDGDMTWLGATDANADSLWRWESGSLLTFTNWAPGEPSNCGGCDCMAVNRDWNSWLWDDSRCTNNYKAICEKGL